MSSNSSDRATKPVSNWLHYYYSLSLKSLLNPHAVVVEAAATREEKETELNRPQVRRASSVRFMESVSVRHLAVEEEDDRHDLYYSKKDIAAFQREEEQEKERQEQERKHAKRNAREQRRLKLAQRKAERRTRELTSTAGASSSTISDKEQKTQTSAITPPRPLRSSNLLLGDFLAKTNKSITPVQSAQDARCAFSVC
jgi:hypothetical protein